MKRGTVKEEGKDGEEELEREEVRRVIKKLKDGKAMESDGIPNKVWKYGGRDHRLGNL